MQKSLKSLFTVKKVVKTLRLKDTNYSPCDYEVYQVTGPKDINKIFAHIEDAKLYIKNLTNSVKANKVMNSLISDLKLADAQLG